MREEAEIYSALYNPQSDYWKGRPPVIPDLLDTVRTLNIRQCFPLLLSGENTLEDKDFVKLLEICINFSFRFITIAGLNNKTLEKLYSDISIEVRRTNDKSEAIEHILSRLKREYIDDEKFLNDFTNKEIKVNKVAKYILKRIEEESFHDDKEKVNKAITLEHILPENPNEEWEHYLKQKKLEKDQLVSRIGNMTLLTEKMNSTAQSKFFTKKRDNYYQYSKLHINEPLKSVTDWTDVEIKDRQAWLGEKAIKLWKLETQ